MPAIKGPWRVKIDASTISASIHGNGGHVCEVWSGRKPSLDTVKDNARLISQAHPMREALYRCLAALTEEGTSERQRAAAIRIARRTLGKTAGC